MERSDGPVIIVGAGLAGLCCARTLALRGIGCVVLEASDDVGGRNRTDMLRGFALDRGFQVLLTAYPEAKRVLDYEALRLGTFSPGAIVRAEGTTRRIVDPWREPVEGVKSLLQPVVTLGDLVPLARMRFAAARAGVESSSGKERTVWDEADIATREVLNDARLSNRALEQFLRPFFGGVFFDPELATSARMFRFTFKMFAEGYAALPAGGMGQIAAQVVQQVAKKQPGAVRLNARVASVEENGRGVRLANGERVEGAAVVVATEGDAAARLLTGGHAAFRGWNGTATLYFAATKPPVDEPMLVLNGDAAGPVNHLAVPSNAAKGYAPAGAALVCANVIGPAANVADDAELERSVRGQLAQWFGEAVNGWEHLRTYRIPRALPRQNAGDLTPPQRAVRSRERVYVCGDHMDNASINGAMVSGRRAAEAVLDDVYADVAARA